MAWMGIAASVAGSVLSSSMQGDAAGDASSAQGQSSAAAIGEQRRQYDLTRSDQAPWREAGSAAQNRLAVILGLKTNARTPGMSNTNALPDTSFDFYDGGRFTRVTGQDGKEWQDTRTGKLYERSPAGRAEARADGALDPVETGPDEGYGGLNKKFTLADRDADPVYQSGLEFGLREGTDGINARALAGGRYDSGATLKALTRFGNDYGSTKANESRNRFVSDQDSIYNRLAGVSSSGQTSTAQVGAAGTNMANNVSELMTGAGNARAAGIVGGANAWGGAASGINNAIGNYQNNQTLQKIFADRGSNSSWSPSGQWWGSSGDNF